MLNIFNKFLNYSRIIILLKLSTHISIFREIPFHMYIYKFVIVMQCILEIINYIESTVEAIISAINVYCLMVKNPNKSGFDFR